MWINTFFKTSSKKEFSEESINELKPSSLSSLCTGNKFCAILLLEEEVLSENRQDLLKQLLEKYVRDKYRFCWTNRGNTEKARGVMSRDAKFAIYNPKSHKVVWTNAEQFGEINKFMENVISGGVKWTKLDAPLGL